MKYRLLIVIFGAILFFAQNLSPVLDGRVAPIYLENRYTFTNYEWARGNVYFKNGFDLPVGGTIILDINQEVGADINLNSGTLSLSGNLDLSLNTGIRSSGFIDAQGNTILFKKSWLFDNGQFVGILSSLILEGVGSNRLTFGQALLNSGIWVRQGVAQVVFRRFNLGSTYQNNFTTLVNAPSLLKFESSSILLLNDLTFYSQTVSFDGSITLFQSNKMLKIPEQLKIESATQLYIQSRVKLEVGIILVNDISSQLILENARLNYVPTGTYSLFFAGAQQGTLLVRGKSDLLTPPGIELSFPQGSSLLIATGSSLTINTGTKLIIG